VIRLVKGTKESGGAQKKRSTSLANRKEGTRWVPLEPNEKSDDSGASTWTKRKTGATSRSRNYLIKVSKGTGERRRNGREAAKLGSVLGATPRGETPCFREGTCSTRGHQRAPATRYIDLVKRARGEESASDDGRSRESQLSRYTCVVVIIIVISV